MSKNKLILLVEDDPVVMVVKTHALKKAGYSVDGATSGELAIQRIINGEIPDLILMDIRLGDGINGLDAAKEILKTIDLPLIFLSSLSDERYIDEALKISPYGYVIKDSPFAVLAASVKLALGLHAARQEIKLKENQLAASEEKYASIFTQSPIAIEFYNSEGLLLEVNDACLEMFGVIDPKEIKGFNLFEDPNVNAETKEVLKSGKSVKLELDFDFELVKKHGLYHTIKSGIIYLEEFISPLIKDGKNTGYIVQLKDIGIRKLSEEKLKKYTEELKILNATKDKFFSIIAHDLKNPFVGLLGLTELLLDNFENFSKDESLKSLDMLRKSASNGFELLKNLLDWSMANSGAMNYLPEKVNLKELVDKNIKLLEHWLTDKSITAVSEITEACIVTADINMINVILRNLLANAVKYTAPGGKITITAKYTEDFIEVSVIDTGIGISKENIDKLFRIDAHFTMAGTEKEQGTGLGLILCKEFVEKHGGKLWAKSKPDKGSEFIFSLPVNKT